MTHKDLLRHMAEALLEECPREQKIAKILMALEEVYEMGREVGLSSPKII